MHAADIQDRDGGVLLMSTLFGRHPFLLKLYADSGYQGPKFQAGLKRVCRQINVEIVKRSDIGKFVVLPKRWIVERTIAWHQSMPSAGKGLGTTEPKRTRLHAMGVNQADATKTLPNHKMISDRLLEPDWKRVE